MQFSKYFLLYTLLPLFILFVASSFIRFMVNHDYFVAYEGTCDEVTQDCFIGCTDDACSEEYYYSKVQKYAVDLYKQCGLNITDCTWANVCLPQNDRNCSIAYCVPEVDGEECETIQENSDTPETEDTVSESAEPSVEEVNENTNI